MRTQGQGPHNYGGRVFCVKVKQALADDNEIYVFGDEVRIDPTGALVVLGAYREYGEDGRVVETPSSSTPMLVIAADQWLAYYAASALDGSAVAVSKWEGEIVS